jgi:hypothetical protein
MVGSSRLQLYAQGLILNVGVDKIIIAQDTLRRFINEMSPGAFASITKIDFKTLDRLMIKPLGVYGSKVEIVRLLRCQWTSSTHRNNKNFRLRSGICPMRCVV